MCMGLAARDAVYMCMGWQLEMLGRGAFGEVRKVRHKLDGRFYAVKKLKLNMQYKEELAKVIYNYL